MSVHDAKNLFRQFSYSVFFKNLKNQLNNNLLNYKVNKTGMIFNYIFHLISDFRLLTISDIAQIKTNTKWKFLIFTCCRHTHLFIWLYYIICYILNIVTIICTFARKRCGIFVRCGTVKNTYRVADYMKKKKTNCDSKLQGLYNDVIIDKYSRIGSEFV